MGQGKRSVEEMGDIDGYADVMWEFARWCRAHGWNFRTELSRLVKKRMATRDQGIESTNQERTVDRGTPSK